MVQIVNIIECKVEKRCTQILLHIGLSTLLLTLIVYDSSKQSNCTFIIFVVAVN